MKNKTNPEVKPSPATHVAGTKSLLSTKTLTPAQKELILNAGIGLVEKEFISIVPLNFQLNSIPENIIFTSKNAVKAILDHPAVSQLRTRNVFCVGEKTAALLKENDFTVVKAADYGNILADAIVKDYQKEDFLFFCGKNRHPALPDTLKANGVRLIEIEVYDTLLEPKKIDRIFDGVLFFSPSAVQSFYSENTAEESIAFCIGKTTASEAEKYTGNIVVANKPTTENLIVQAVKKFK